jgi:ADP-heptose:LPS heptosyltransferase
VLKLISQNYKIFYSSKVNPTQLVSSNSSTIFEPEGKYLSLGIGSIIGSEKFPKAFIEELIRRDFAVVYFCDEIPENVIIHPNIVYVVATWAWFTHTAFVDYHLFKLVFGSGPATYPIAEKFIKLSCIDCKLVHPILDSFATIEQLLIELDPILRSKAHPEKPKTLLFDTVSFCPDRGLGDILMTTIALKKLVEQGWIVDYVVRKGAGQILKGNPYINKLWITQHELNTKDSEGIPDLPRSQDYTWHFTLATNLEDYKVSRNLQGRIDSICDLLRINSKEDMDFTPALELTDEEKEYGKQFMNPNKKNIVLGLISTGSDNRSYPKEYYDELLNKLNRTGKYNIIVTDQSPMKVLERPHVINLSGKLNVRQWASVVYNSDGVVSMDTGIYWIALAFNKPCVVMFTTIAPELRVNHHKDLVRAVYPKLECKPCYDRQMVVNINAWKECAKAIRAGNSAPCTKALVPDLVIKNIKEWFSIKRESRR